MKQLLTTINGFPIYRQKIGFLPTDPRLKTRTRSLRKGYVLSETIFWLQVKTKKFHGIDFDRQRIIGRYIVDFYVKSLGLVVEIDGTSHIGKEDYDARRDKYLESLGLKVYHISDLRVKIDLENVLKELEKFIIEEFEEREEEH